MSYKLQKIFSENDLLNGSPGVVSFYDIRQSLKFSIKIWALGREDRGALKQRGREGCKGWSGVQETRVKRGMAEASRALVEGQYSRYSHDGIVARFEGSRPKNGVNDKPALESVSKSIRVR